MPTVPHVDKTKPVTMSFRVDPELDGRVDVAVARLRKTKQEFLRVAVERELERQERKLSQQDAVNAA